MEIIETRIKDLLIIKPDVFLDERGYFFESYNKQRFLEHGRQYALSVSVCYYAYRIVTSGK